LKEGVIIETSGRSSDSRLIASDSVPGTVLSIIVKPDQLADESFFALPSDRFANFDTLTKITVTADAPDDIRGWPFSEEIGVPKRDGRAAPETVTADSLTRWRGARGRFPLTGFFLFA